MIERHVYIKLEDEHSHPEGRAEVIARSRELASVPGVLGVRVGTPADDGSRQAWDLCLIVSFARIEDVDPYRVHADHQAYRAFIDPRMAVLKAWNFEI